MNLPEHESTTWMLYDYISCNKAFENEYVPLICLLKETICNHPDNIQLVRIQPYFTSSKV